MEEKINWQDISNIEILRELRRRFDSNEIIIGVNEIEKKIRIVDKDKLEGLEFDTIKLFSDNKEKDEQHTL